MAGRSDPAWKYGKEVDSGRKDKYIQCNFCNHICKGGVKRMKDHLACNRKNVKACNKVPDEVKGEIREYLNMKEHSKNLEQRKREEQISSGAYYTTNPSVGGSSGASISSKQVRGPMNRYVVNLDDVNDDATEATIPGPVNAKEARNRVCLDIGRFFYENGIPFNVASSPSFVNMCRSLGNYGHGIKPPTAYELRTWILDEEEQSAKAIVDDIKKTWIQTGVSILSDGWKDMRGRQLINFLVNNPHGTVFLRSIDAFDAVKDADLLFKLLDEVVEKVGKDLVIQVVTDNASNYKKAGKLLMEKRPRLWWTPCAAHCIDLMLEKVGELPQHKNALIKSKKVSNFIYNHGWVLNLMRENTKKELIRPAATRFATAYLTLQSMYSLKQPLVEMFASSQWAKSTWAKKSEGKQVKKIILHDRSFWGSVAYAIKTTEPLVSVLRMTDSEKMPGMRFIYGAMDKAKEDIQTNLGGVGGAHTEIWSIIDDKWEYQLHRHLHAAAYFLNPHYQYEDNFSTHPEVKLGLLTCMEKLIPNSEERVKADLQIDDFRNRKGLFGFAQAKGMCKQRSPADWWLQFGDGTPELTSFAVKILSLTRSSSACERNWSTFNQIHTKKRNRLATEKLNKLVYIMYNKKLRAKFLRKRALKVDEDPLVIDEMPSDDEWIAEQDDASGMSDGSRVTNAMPEEGGSSRPSGSTQGRKRKDRGKGLQLVDEEP